MIGIPLEMVPEFPAEASTVLLTESAKFDQSIVSKMKRQLLDGKKVVITSGLLKALQGKGLEDITEIECTQQKATVREFPRWGGAASSESEILIPEIRYPTNDAWEIVSGASQGVGYPILLQASYGPGQLFILTIPDNPGDLYILPPPILTQIRAVVAGDLPVRLEGPGQTGLFLYDNRKFIVENFAPPGGSPITAKALVGGKYTKLVDVVSGERIPGQASGDKTVFEIALRPASYRVFSIE
jgi:hypothetical protein